MCKKVINHFAVPALAALFMASCVHHNASSSVGRFEKFAELQGAALSTNLEEVVELVFSDQRYQVTAKGMRLILTGQKGLGMQIEFREYNPVMTKDEIDALLGLNAKDATKSKRKVPLFRDAPPMLNQLTLADVAVISLRDKKGNYKVLVWED